MCGDSATLGDQAEKQIQDPGGSRQCGRETQDHRKYENHHLHIGLGAGSPGSVSFCLFLSGIEPNSKIRAGQGGRAEKPFVAMP